MTLHPVLVGIGVILDDFMGVPVPELSQRADLLDDGRAGLFDPTFPVMIEFLIEPAPAEQAVIGLQKPVSLTAANK